MALGERRGLHFVQKRQQKWNGGGVTADLNSCPFPAQGFFVELLIFIPSCLSGRPALPYNRMPGRRGVAVSEGLEEGPSRYNSRTSVTSTAHTSTLTPLISATISNGGTRRYRRAGQILNQVSKQLQKNS